jgi:malonyl-CoA/methylmalonyl-CoA synthetase
VVPANAAYPPAELAALVAAARPDVAVLDDPSRLDPSPGFPVATPSLASLPPASTVALDTAELDDTALIIYTSGTTGVPKGVPLSHGNLLASAHGVRLAWRWEPSDTLALCLPLFHMHGLGVGLHGTLVSGASALLLPKFEPGLVAEAVDAGASLFFGVPTMYHRLAESPALPALSKLRLAVRRCTPAAARSCSSGTG